MSVWKKVLVAASAGMTLVVMATVAASASGAGRAALQAAGASAVLMASSSPSSSAQPHGGVASGPGVGPIQISIGKNWTLDGALVVRGTITVTCGPFINNSGSDTAQVTVEEAPGSQVGHAGASVPIACNGSHQTVNVSALVNDLPFRAGDGAVGVNANACGQDPSSLQFVCQTGTAVTPVTLK